MVRRASVYAKVSGSGITAIAFVVLLMAAASCLAGVVDAASPDRLYATGFNGSYPPPGYSNNVSPGDYPGNASLFVIDPADGRLISSMPTGEAGYFLAIDPSGTRLYSTNGYSRNVTIINLTDMSVAAYLSMNSPPCGIVTSSDGTKVYVALPEERTIAVINAGTSSVQGFIPLNHSPYSLAVSSDGTMLYATGNLDGTISAIDIPGNRLLSTIPVGTRLSEAVFIGNHTVMVAGEDDTVYAIDAPVNAVKAAIRGVIDPSYIVFDLSKNALIVTSLTDKNITKIDASGYNITVTRAFWSAHHGRPAVSSDGSRLYVPDEWGKILVINASSLVDTGRITLAYPVTALIYMPAQAVIPGPTPTPAPATPAPFPGASGITGPTFYPGYTGSPAPITTPMPTPPGDSTATGQQPGLLPYRDWVPPFSIRPITQSDILLVLIGIAGLLVILSGITYLMMFRKKKE